MKRLVYSPHVQAYISADEGVFDLSPYIVSGSTNRKVNQVSGAQLTVRNPIFQDTSRLIFTEHQNADGTIGPLFHPMDPIIILMQRLQGYPVQVFTGYLDKSPYLQLYPGLCTIEASCTLKRLLYTQWDAALPFVRYFLSQYGWQLTSESGLVNPTAESSRIKAQAGQLKNNFNDGSIGALLFAVLNIIGDWDASTIWIEQLPSEIKDLVTTIYQQTSKEAQQGSDLFKSLVQQILGQTSQGAGSPAVNLHGSGPAWLVPASAEDDPPGAAASCGPLPSDRRGYSVLSVSGTSGDKATAGQALSPGSPWPCSYQLVITNPANGKSVTTGHVDNGAGSDSILPVVGLYPQTRSDLGLDGSGSYHVIIQATSGQNLSPVRGTQVKASNPTGNPASGPVSGNPFIGHRNQNAIGLSPAAAAHAPQSGTTAQQAGRSPGGKKGAVFGSVLPTNSNGVINPIPGFQIGRQDAGIDACASAGDAILAPAACTLSQVLSDWYNGQPLLLFQFDQTPPGAPTQYWYVAEQITPKTTAIGTHFNQGDTVAVFAPSGSCIEIGWGSPTANSRTYAEQAGRAFEMGSGSTSVDGASFQNYFSIGGGSPQKDTGGGSSGGSGGGAAQSTTSSVAAAFSTFINLPSIFDSAEALAFTGKRSFMADQPLMPFIEQLCQASLRNFMSMPNGNFFAFFPDYFGLFGRKYYWEIRDIEIIDARIDLSDDPLVTHVAVAGDVTQFHGQIDVFDMVLTSGIFTIFDALATGYIGGLTDIAQFGGKGSNAKSAAAAALAGATKKKDKAQHTVTAPTVGKAQSLAFLRKYGARPYVEQAPMVRSPFFELFLAFQKFMLLWSKQFQTTIEVTFMPELFPGGLIGLPDHHLQLYVEEVAHNFDYQQGFTTTVNVSSPSKLDAQSNPNLADGLARPAALVPPPAPATPTRFANPRTGVPVKQQGA